MNTGKITSRQVTLLLIMFRLFTVIAYMPVINIPPANQDIWIVILLSFFYSVTFKAPLLFLANKFNNITFIKVMEKIFGVLLGRLIGVLFGLYFIFYSIVLVLIQLELVASDILPYVPNWITTTVLVTLILYMGSKKLMVLFWSGELFAPINISSIIILILAGLRKVDFRVILPILADSTFYDISLGAAMVPFLLTDTFILVLSVPYLENKKDINKIFIKSGVYSLVLSAITVIVTQGALGIEQTRHSNFPFLIFTRLINFRQTLERIDPIYVITWISTNTMKILAYIYLSSAIFRDILGMKDNKKALYIISILVGSISLYISIRRVVTPLSGFLNTLLMTLAATFMTIIPTIALIVYFFRRKTLNKEEKLDGGV